MNDPLIYTSKGNMLISSLRQEAVWTDNADETILASELWDGDECVRREVHIYKRKGLQVGAAVGLMG